MKAKIILLLSVFALTILHIRTTGQNYAEVTSDFLSDFTYGWTSPCIADIDGDGLFDLLVGDDYQYLYHFEQNSESSTTFTKTTNQFSNLYTDHGDPYRAINPTISDIDGDGLLDLFVGHYYGGHIERFEQVSINSYSFSKVSPSFNGIDVGGGAAPHFAYIDNDNLLDLLVGKSGTGDIQYYEQASLNDTTFNLVSNSFNSIALGLSTPYIADIDGDNLLDIFVGNTTGDLDHYEQDAAYSTSFTLVTATFDTIDIGNESVPLFTDIDNDGYLDILIGENNGFVNHWESNTQTAITSNVITNAATSVDHNSAVLGGTISDNGAPHIYQRGVIYSSTDPNCIADYQVAYMGPGGGNYSAEVFPVSSETTYYFRAFFRSSLGTFYGGVNSFTTTSGPPRLSTNETTDVMETTAVSGGNIIDNGGYNVSARGVCWSTSSNPTTSNSKTTDGTGSGQFSSNITGLTINTTYYVRAYATNSQGTAYGEEKSFIPKVFNLRTTTFNNLVVNNHASPTFTDLDNDGLLDMLTGDGSKILLYEQNSIGSCNFSFITEIPETNYGMEPMSTIIDLDNDNLLDLFWGEWLGEIHHMEQNSIGSNNFTTIDQTFNSINVGNLSYPAFCDIDHDNLYDLLVGEDDGTILHYEQDAAWGSTFTLVTSTFNSIDVGDNSRPTVTDLDGDGLLDLLIGEYDGNINHYEQNAANSQAFTLVTNNFHSITTSDVPHLSFTDLDGDYALDFFIGERDGTIQHWEVGEATINNNCITTTTAGSITSNSAVLGGDISDDNSHLVHRRGVCYSVNDESPDLDDTKALMGTGTGTYSATVTNLPAGRIYYRAFYTNALGTFYGTTMNFIATAGPPGVSIDEATNIVDVSATSGGDVVDDGGGGSVTSRGVCWSTSQNPTTADSKTIDGSGTGQFTSSVTGLSAETSYYIRAYASNAQGTNYSKEIEIRTRLFHEINDSFSSADIGEYSKPLFFDIDGDGLLDLLIGEAGGNINHYEQNSSESTSFTITTKNFNSINVGTYSSPTVIDIDGDALIDLLIGNNDGEIYHYEQDGVNSGSFSLVSSSFSSLDIGSKATPEFNDIDGDGLLDLLIGEDNGNINHYEQDATNSLSFTLVTENFNSIDVGDRSVPVITDLDNDGLLDLLIGEKDGNINYYEQNSTNSLLFSLQGESLSSIDVGSNSAPVITDIDSDSKPDLLIGEALGNIHHWESYASTINSSGISTSAPAVVTGTEADLGGNITDDSSHPVLRRGICYSASNNTPDLDDDQLAMGSGNGSFSETITGLYRGQTFYYRAFTSSVLGTLFGDTQELKTFDVSTNPVEGIDLTQAICGGNIPTYSGNEVIARGICWNTSPNPTTADTKTTDGATIGEYQSTLTGLQKDTRYYVRAYATNSLVTLYGGEYEFSTPIETRNMLNLEGSDQYGLMNGNLPDEGTIEAWIYMDNFDNSYRILDAGNASSNWYLGYSSYSGYYFKIGQSSSAYFGYTTTSKWHHVAATWTKNNLLVNFYLYFDGHLKSNVMGNTWSDPSTNIYIGSNYNNTLFFDGKMDELRIWNSAKTPAQILANMHQSVNPSSPGLVCYYDFDHASGITISDKTGNGYDANLVNTTNNDWLVSSAPVGDYGTPVRTNLLTFAGITGAQIKATISVPSPVEDDRNLGIYTYGDGSEAIDAETLPEGITERASIVWGVEETGNCTADLVFDYTNVSVISNDENIKLLRREDPFSDWTNATTVASINTVSNTISLSDVTNFSQFSVAEGLPYGHATGNCIYFDGFQEYINCGNHSSLNTGNILTIEAWIYPHDLSRINSIYSTRHENTHAGAFQLQVGYLDGSRTHGVAVTGVGTEVAQTSEDILENKEWTHVAYTRAGSGAGTHTIYVNGISQNLVVDDAYNFIDNSGIKVIGSGTGGGQVFEGMIDEVRIWNITRTQQEIRDNMHRILNGNESGLVAYWQLNEGSGTSASDIKQNNDGTLVNLDSEDWVESYAIWKRWEGNNSTAWSDFENWSTVFSQPTLNDMVLIQNTHVQPQIANEPTSPATGSVLAIEKHASLTISAGKAFTVSDTTINMNGINGIVIKSDASATASLIQSAPVGATIERYLSQTDYHYISTPVNNQYISTEFVDAGSNPLPATVDFYKFDEPANLWRNIKDGSGNLNLSFETQFVVGRGYAYANSDAIYIKEFKGQLNYNDISVSLDKQGSQANNGWNLVGNPFPANLAVNAPADATHNFLSDNASALDDNHEAIYLYDGSDYLTVNQVSAETFISPAQGFFVKAAADMAQLVFNSNQQKHGASTFYKNGSYISRFKINITGPQSETNTTMIAFIEGASKGLDPGYDARKLKGNYYISLYSILVDDDGGDYAIQSLPVISNQQVKLGLDATEAGLYEFNNFQMEDMGNTSIFLEDKVENVFVNLNQNPSYSFTTMAGSFDDRFVLHFGNFITEIDDENSEERNRLNILTDGEVIYVQNISKEIQSGTFEIYNLAGQLINYRSLIIEAYSRTSIKPRYRAGIYIISFQSNDKKYTQKVILE